MNTQQVLRKVRSLDLKTPADFKAAHIPLVKEGSGIFRVVMRVKGLNIAVKFPLASGKDNNFRAGKLHSTCEVRKIQKLSKIAWMRRHLPTVYHHDRKSGVLVVSWHPEFGDGVDSFRALGRLTTKVIAKKTGVLVTDIHEDNVRRGRTKREAILVDLGY